MRARRPLLLSFSGTHATSLGPTFSFFLHSPPATHASKYKCAVLPIALNRICLCVCSSEYSRSALRLPVSPDQRCHALPVTPRVHRNTALHIACQNPDPCFCRNHDLPYARNQKRDTYAQLTFSRLAEGGLATQHFPVHVLSLCESI